MEIVLNLDSNKAFLVKDALQFQINLTKTFTAEAIVKLNERRKAIIREIEAKERGE